MPSYPFMQVDAFTDRPLSGNPCAVLFDTEGMDDGTMLAIAREMNLSETAFVRSQAQKRRSAAEPAANVFAARYFTPAEGIPLAGHPTIATAFALVDSGRLRLAGDTTQLTLELKVGPIPVEIDSVDGKIRVKLFYNPEHFYA